MELRELRTFCAVVETGSFSKAAKVVHLTQPTVTLQVQSLEGSLGACLFNRSRRDRVLTEEGKAFYGYARKIISLCDEAVQAISDVDSLAKGTLRVGASTIVGEYILPSQLASFKGIYPCVEISLKIGDTTEIMEDVIKGALEVGIVGAKPTRQELDFEEFIKEELVLIVAPNHRWASKDKIGLDELKGEPLLLRTEGSGTRMAIEKRLEEGGLEKGDLNVIMSLGNTEAIKRGVMAGIGVSIVPKIAIENELELNLIKEVKVEGIDLAMDFYVVYNPDRFRSRIPEVFLEHLSDCLKEEHRTQNPAPR
ncbi:MAG: selenium metabolism-associated LysR family transcriptional regulator [bacterium]